MTGRKPRPFLSRAVESSIPEAQAVIERHIAERFAEDVLIPIEREEARKFIEGDGYPHEPRGILSVHVEPGAARNPRDWTCKTCGSHVSTYNCNQHLVEARPEASQWDWWAACDNEACPNAYGEGYFQGAPEWTVQGDPS